MDTIRDSIKKERPNLSENTLKTYVSLLTSLHKKVFGDDINLANFRNVKKIMEALKDKAASSRKTSLSALFVLTGIEDYRNKMTEDIKEYKEDVSKREMSDKQKDAFMTQEEIANKLNQLKIEADLIYRKPEKTTKDINTIQNYILLALTSGYYIPPRRSLDWVYMKTKNISDTDNYMDKGKFFFNTYKGSEKKGQQVIPIPKPLQLILKKWLAINNSDYLLFDVNNKPLNSVKINQRLNKILKSGSAINMLRHSYLTSKFGNLIDENEKLESTMNAMGSSSAQQNIYIQKIDKKDKK